MNTIEMDSIGGPEVLIPGTRAAGQPVEGQVLIRLYAAGMNGSDLVQRCGRYPPPKGVMEFLGLEVSGEVVVLG